MKNFGRIPAFVIAIIAVSALTSVPVSAEGPVKKIIGKITGKENPATAQGQLSDVEFYGYKVTHHMGAMVQHIEKFGFNTFDHPPMPDHRFFVITPALDHFYSKAVIRHAVGPCDPRYARQRRSLWKPFGP